MQEFNIIDSLQKNLEQLRPLERSRNDTLEKKFRLEFNYNTNHIEGNTITYSETELLLIFDDAKGEHTFRELEEMKGSDVAFNLVKELAADKERPLTEQNIKYLNEILLVRPFWKEAITEDGQSTRRLIKVGGYKDYPNSVRLQNGEIFHYATPADTPILMGELIQWFRGEEEKKEYNVVELAALFHYKFVCIHPFDDGNGRLSRLLMNYVFFKNNLPPVIIKTEDKSNYLQALNRADVGDVDSFIKYIAKQLIWSLEISIKAAKGESIDEPGDLSKKLKVFKQQHKIGNERAVKKSKEAVLEIFNNSLVPLFEKVSDRLHEFESLFKSSNEYLGFGENNAFGRNLPQSIGAIKQKLETSEYSEIFYMMKFKNFRVEHEYRNFNVSFAIRFHEHVFEVVFDATIYLSKLYTQILNEQEMNDISETLGLKLFSEIENANQE